MNDDLLHAALIDFIGAIHEAVYALPTKSDEVDERARQILSLQETMNDAEIADHLKISRQLLYQTRQRRGVKRISTELSTPPVDGSLQEK